VTNDKFWLLIALLDWDMSGDDEAVVEPAVAALSQRSIEDIEAFEGLLAEKLHALDTEAHARQVGEHAYRGPQARNRPASGVVTARQRSSRSAAHAPGNSSSMALVG
jgi:hypothetical protein